jgi:serine/threonine protein kinase
MEIKLIDFGLSGVIDDSRFVPKQYFDESWGTVIYMAPE